MIDETIGNVENGKEIVANDRAVDVDNSPKCLRAARSVQNEDDNNTVHIWHKKLNLKIKYKTKLNIR